MITLIFWTGLISAVFHPFFSHIRICVAFSAFHVFSGIEFRKKRFDCVFVADFALLCCALFLAMFKHYWSSLSFVTVALRLCLLLAASFDSQNLSSIRKPVDFKIVRAKWNSSTADICVTRLLVFFSESVFEAQVVSGSDVSEEIHFGLAGNAFDRQIWTRIFDNLIIASVRIAPFSAGGVNRRRSSSSSTEDEILAGWCFNFVLSERRAASVRFHEFRSVFNVPVLCRVAAVVFVFLACF